MRREGSRFWVSDRCLDSKTQGAAHLSCIPPFPVGRVEEGRDVRGSWACSRVRCVYVNLQHTKQHRLAYVGGAGGSRDKLLSLEQEAQARTRQLTKSQMSASFLSRPESPICSNGPSEPKSDGAPILHAC